LTQTGPFVSGFARPADRAPGCPKGRSANPGDAADEDDRRAPDNFDPRAAHNRFARWRRRRVWLEIVNALAGGIMTALCRQSTRLLSV
jgi:hypothetical protein